MERGVGPEVSGVGLGLAGIGLWIFRGFGDLGIGPGTLVPVDSGRDWLRIYGIGLEVSG